jgi:YVTN family beta-propeller protein
VFDTATNRVAATVALNHPAYLSAVHPAGTRAYVGGFGDISVIETATNRVIGSIGMGGNGLAIHPDGTRLYTNDLGPGSPGCGICPPTPGFLDVVDTSSNLVTARVQVGVGPSAIVVNPKGTLVYVANREGSVYAIDTRTNQVRAAVPVSGSAVGLTVDPAGSKVYVSSSTTFQGSLVTVMDATTLATIAQIGIDPVYLDQVAVNPAGTRLYVIRPQVPEISVVDLTANVYAARIALSAPATGGVAFDPSGARAYAPTRRSDGVGQLSVIDTATNREVATVALGLNPNAVGQFIQPFPPGVLGLSAAIPDNGGDQGSATISIQGRAIQPGASARLARTGQVDIAGSDVRVSPFADSVTAAFDLTGKVQGAWDVIVTNPDGSAATLPGGFTIAPASPCPLRVDIVGRSAFRAGFTQTYTIVVSNCSNQDSPPVIVGIQLPPATAIPDPIDPFISLGPPPPFPGSPPFDWPSASACLPLRSGPFCPVVVPSIPPRGTFAIPIHPTFNPDPTVATLPIRAELYACGIPTVSVPWWARGTWLNSIDPDKARECLLAIGFGLLTFALGIADFGNCQASIVQGLVGFGQVYSDSLRQGSQPIAFIEMVLSVVGAIVDCLHLPNDSISKSLRWASIVLAVAKLGSWQEFLGALKLAQTCLDAFFPNSQAATWVAQVLSHDPNEKDGSPGVRSGRYVAAEAPTSYGIFFENMSTATAPAQQVTITDQLDVGTLDVSSAALGRITFGSSTLSPPAGSRAFTRDVDLRPATNLIVRVDASINSASGLVTWRFISLDPATGLLVTDPLAGFLPPNKAPPQGEGSVALTVKPIAGLATGTQLRNRATVVFDNSAPITTADWLNTLDNTPPSSQVLALAPIQSTLSFPVSWSGTDVGSGISDYAIFVSDNGNPFQVWLPSATATSAIFTGVNGHTYAFYSRARDQVANREGPKTVAEATTKVVACSTPPTTSAVLMPSANAAGWNNTNVTVTMSATDACGSGVQQISFSQAGAQTAGGLVLGASASIPVSSQGTTTITYFAKDNLGNQELPKTVTVQVDKTRPTTTFVAASGTLPPFWGLLTATASGTVSSGGTIVLGFTATCFNTQGLVAKLDATDNPGGSGVAQITYSLTGAQVGTGSPAGSSVAIPVTIPGMTTLAYFATDLAGNAETPKADMIFVGVSEGAAVSCASTPVDFTKIPPHGSVALSGSLGVGGISYPFTVAFSY